MNQFEHIVTLIIPIYNMEKYLEMCLNSVVEQTIDKRKIEVLLINDGSNDNSAEIMHHFASKHPYFKEIHKENEGLSRTRNRGIMEAKGKYIMYLDADDTLTPNTLQAVTDFFDKHYEEIDLVAYFEEVREIDGEVKPHFRHKMLSETGVYDLTKLENAFCAQTNINICVKNLGKDNIYFDIGKNFRQEDQKYCTDILLRKMKLGYCAEGTYQYLKNENSVTSTMFYSYYLFEPSMDYWETLFNNYEKGKVPYYIQAMYLSDIAWKTRADILLPYHYSEKDFLVAKQRILNLLEEVSDEIITNHPNIEPIQGPYFLLKKKNNDVEVIAEDNYIEAVNHGQTLYREEIIHVVVNQCRIENGMIRLGGHMKSPIFSFVKKPELFLLQAEKKERTEIDLYKSSYSYYKSKLEIACVWGFEIELSVTKLESFKLEVDINGNSYRTYCTFTKDMQLGKKRNAIVRGDIKLEYENGRFIIRKLQKKEINRHTKKLLRRYIRKDPRKWCLRNMAWSKKRKKDIWLYYDCKGVAKDNGYFQFEHDLEIEDGVERYYVVNEDDFKKASKLYPKRIRSKLIKFGSTKHITLFLACKKVVTAFVERLNINPFLLLDDYKEYLDLFDLPKLYYLQHGVLHAHVPWKYSYDRVRTEKEIISTRFEEENLKSNYCFDEKHLSKVGMPRYDNIDNEREACVPRRILFAPSWRKYLIGMKENEWTSTESVFLKSDYFKEIQEFLNSKELCKLLEDNNMYLDYKAHPIFERYNHLYDIENERISFAEKRVEESDYSIFITDFSSFVYDFAYLKRPIVYFVPDYILIKSGMNFYRQLDMPLEDGLGELTKTGDDVVVALKRIIDNNYKPLPEYEKKLDRFFFYYDDSQRDRIYKEIKD